MLPGSDDLQKTNNQHPDAEDAEDAEVSQKTQKGQRRFSEVFFCVLSLFRDLCVR